jgi:hypothetical protein
MRSAPYALCIAAIITACGRAGKSEREMPSRKEFFLRRDTPVDSIRVANTEAAASASTPAGEADGIVVDAYWGNPLANAQVFYRDAEHPEKSIGVITDADGHFQLGRVPPRFVMVRAALIGYRADSARVDGRSGQFVRFALSRQALRVCGLPIQTGPPQEAPFAISVYARDARTRKAPSVAVTISLRDGKYSDSSVVLMREGPADSLLVGAARGRDGVYDVEVNAPGYKPWYLNRVRPIVSDCDQVIGRSFTAWLIPTS